MTDADLDAAIAASFSCAAYPGVPGTFVVSFDFSPVTGNVEHLMRLAISVGGRRFDEGRVSVGQNDRLIRIRAESAMEDAETRPTIRRWLSGPNGFTPKLRALCQDRCAGYGKPPCWRLHELAEGSEPVSPCEDCVAGKPVGEL